MHEIKCRSDVKLLVDTFYASVKKDVLLGPIFDHHLSERTWPAHLAKLTDFWETNLLGIPRFRGNPSARHVEVDRHAGFTVTEVHFERWLGLWGATVDRLFTGELAVRAKVSARRIATIQFRVILQHRPA